MEQNVIEEVWAKAKALADKPLELLAHVKANAEVLAVNTQWSGPDELEVGVALRWDIDDPYREEVLGVAELKEAYEPIDVTLTDVEVDYLVKMAGIGQS
ncbi:hypothetical protein [Ferrimonas marina]|uniref:Uncharacterized protein n=1 Tax=Ferrimonas marina TaxID=299255 RepID=A0A1M5TXG8_9GAMM|nr:hypothetical protein [Ferrimonas marina]SHH55316.1 hypothetical protein SAMN02745129_2313 [Ferrimonas marina]